MTRPILSLLAILSAAQVALNADAAPTAPLTASVLENDVLRLRVERLTDDFPQEFLAAQPTNKLDGIVLDLRSADGAQNALPAASGLFAGEKFPLVILVNGQTRGAAAALAADLRTAGDGILIGGTNFTGQVRPDIAVTVPAEEEEKFLANPFFVPVSPKPVSGAGTNEYLEFVDHTSEADLVHERVKDGEEDEAATPRPKPSQPVIRDPALARAVDLLQALAALHPARG
jgi:hypothetical protein